MNPKDRSLDELLEEFMADPGSAESAQLEFKAKEKVESTEGKRDLAKKAAAIANTKGGTIVVGVGEGNRDDIIQSFDPRSEIKRDLASVFRDNTKPPVDQVAKIDMEKIGMGARLLRIDIDPSNTYPIEFKDRSSGEYKAYCRVEDTTREMKTSDVVEFTKRRMRPMSEENTGLQETYTIPSSEIDISTDSHSRESLGQRTVINIEDHALVVPAKAYLVNSFKKTVSYDITKYANDSGLPGMNELLKEAKEELNADLGVEFGYGIKYQSKEIIGRGAKGYLRDLENIEDVIEVLGGDGDSDPRPVAIAGTRCDFGFVWFQTQYHTGSISRVKCGVMMSDIPINTSPLKRVFGDQWFEQNNSLKSIQLRLTGDEVVLSNSRDVLLGEATNQGQREIIADNPFYGNKQTILDSIGDDAPESFINTISAVDRLPFDVRGGYSSDDEYHSMGDIEMVYVYAVVPTYFVWPMCNPHTISPSEDS